MSAATRGQVPAARLSDRLRVPGSYRHAFLVVALVALVGAGQLVEDASNGIVQMLSSPPSIPRWTVVALVLYELVLTAFVYRTVQRSLQSLRLVVKIEGASFSRYERAIRRRDKRMDLVLLLGSAVIVLILFNNGRLVLDQSDALPHDPVGMLFALVGYVVVGWAGLRLLYVASRMGLLLGRLSREPLDINVFDTAALLPFGNIALAVALAPAGIIAILLVGMGPPSGLFGQTILMLASLASLLALILPLRGVHRQMAGAKDAALDKVNTRVGQLFDEVSTLSDLDAIQMARLSDSSGALIPLRKTIGEMTTWPFRDTLAFGRAVLIAMAPLIYTTLNELIRLFLIAPLGR